MVAGFILPHITSIRIDTFISSSLNTSVSTTLHKKAETQKMS